MSGTQTARLSRKYIFKLSALYPFKMKLVWKLKDLARITVSLEEDKKQKGNSVISLHLNSTLRRKWKWYFLSCIYKQFRFWPCWAHHLASEVNKGFYRVASGWWSPEHTYICYEKIWMLAANTVLISTWHLKDGFTIVQVITVFWGTITILLPLNNNSLFSTR